jgi:hypothetical protein
LLGGSYPSLRRNWTAILAIVIVLLAHFSVAFVPPGPTIQANLHCVRAAVPGTGNAVLRDRPKFQTNTYLFVVASVVIATGLTTILPLTPRPYAPAPSDSAFRHSGIRAPPRPLAV